MYQEWMEKIPVTGTIEDVPEEKEYPHIIDKLKPKEEIETFIIRYPDNQELMDKINEIIQVVNIMMRGGK